MMGGYNGAMHGSFGSAQYQGHRRKDKPPDSRKPIYTNKVIETSYGSNASMESMSYNTMASANYGSFANMSRTRGQNTSTANVVQGNRSKYCHPSYRIYNINK